MFASTCLKVTLYVHCLSCSTVSLDFEKREHKHFSHILSLRKLGLSFHF